MNRRLLVAGHARIVSVLALVSLLTTGCSSPEDDRVPSAAPTVSDPAIEAALDEAWAAINARYPSAIRPDVDIVRIVTSEEWAETLSQCLVDEGFPYVEATVDGGMTWSDVPSAQLEAFDIARFTCSAMYPQDPSHQEPLTIAQLDRLYEYYTGEMTTCLTELGYEVPPPPSRQSFRESYTTDPWLPFASAYEQRLTQESYAILVQTCPQVPTDLWQE